VYNEPCVRSLVEFEGSVSRQHQDAFRDGNELNVTMVYKY
jgi:hypothetical protein